MDPNSPQYPQIPQTVQQQPINQPLAQPIHAVPQYQQQFSQPFQQPVQVPHSPVLSRDEHSSVASKIEQIIALFYVFVASILLFRFGLGLFGAQSSPFVDFVFQISVPFMLPFQGMFGESPQVGYYVLEFESLVAIAVYALIFLGIGKLFKIVLK